MTSPTTSVVQPLEGRCYYATYFVSPTGSDKNSGTSSTAPLATLAAVSAKDLNAGDRVLLQGGATFKGTLSLTREDSGTATAPVVVSTYGTGRANVIAPAGMSAVWVYNAQGLSFSNLNLRSAAPAAGTNPPRATGFRLMNGQTGDTKLSYVRLRDIDVSNFAEFGVSIEGHYGKSGFRDVELYGVNAHDNYRGGITSFGVFSQYSTAYAHENIRVLNSTAHHNYGIAGFGSHTGSGIVLSDVDKAVIAYSTAYENGANSDATQGGPYGIWVWDARSAHIHHNTSHHNHTRSSLDGGGFDLDGGVTYSVMEYNNSYANDGPGYLLAQFKGARPFNNNYVRYNTSTGDAVKHQVPLLLWAAERTNTLQTSYIYGNTISSRFSNPVYNAAPGNTVWFGQNTFSKTTV